MKFIWIILFTITILSSCWENNLSIDKTNEINISDQLVLSEKELVIPKIENQPNY